MKSRLKDTLLLVGDANSDRAWLREIFETSYNLLEAENTWQAVLLLKQNEACVAAVLLDLQETSDEDASMLNKATRAGSDNAIPVLSLIAPTGTGDREELEFNRGASDVIIKPYTPTSIRRRVQVITDLHRHKWHLETLVKEQSEMIRNTNQVVLDALSAIIEHRSTESGNHILRIRRFAKILLEDVAISCPEYNLTETAIESIASASALHDIGKISISDAILNKPDKLTDEEYEVMKAHTTVGGRMIQNLSGIGDVDYLRYAYNIALYHHERWDGHGYPSGLSGDDIPICAQVVGIADVFDALTTERTYKPAFPYEHSINMILNGECGKFSPKLLECFKHVRNQFMELAHQYSDGYSPKLDNITIPLAGPVWKTHKLNSLQLSHVKYQTLLHYANDTVIEFDLDQKIYHMVYNPNPEFDSLILNTPYETVVQGLLIHGLHPDDQTVLDELRQSFVRDFFELGLRKKIIRCRVYSHSQLNYIPYEITLLRVNTQNQEQRIILVVFHKTDNSVGGTKAELPKTLHASPALYGLVSSALRCYSDRDMTINAGAADLYFLTGYTEEEIRNQFCNRYTDLIFPEDRIAYCESIQKLLDTGGHMENEYRLVRKDGSMLWVLDKSRAYTEADGEIYVYHAIRDNSLSKSIFHELQVVNKRNQAIIDQLGGIIFEWDLLSDKLSCSHKWEEHFGYPPLSENYGAQMEFASHFHPDDIPVVRSCIEQLKDSQDTVCSDVRIANSDAKYLWTRITATAYRDENGVLTRIIGVLQNIDTQKRSEFDLKEQAEQDSLTKLLNKVSTKRLITEYLLNRNLDSLSAMLIVDLDNFKLINDNYGHLYGDTVLSQVGLALKNLFRGHDFIGRIGGDEFLVFIREIPNIELVDKRCEMLLDMLRDILTQNTPDLNVSCSIGVALVPHHGTSYTDLFRHADEALYLSKRNGKNTYTLYDPQKQHINLLDNIQQSTRIDSDEEPGMADASFVRYVFQRLYESDNIIQTIDDILTYIGEQLRVSRVYIFENNDDNTTCSNTFEWCNEGITPEKDSLQNISYITDIPGWPEIYNEKGVFYCTDIAQLKPEYKSILEPQGIKSMLQCAIIDQGVFRGYVGFDECVVHRAWTKEQISLLEFLAQVLAMFLLKKRTQDKVMDTADSLCRILDQQDEWIYVIDPDTYELKFLNAATRKLAQNSKVGMTCFQAFMGRSEHCENCPVHQFRQDKIGTAIVVNAALDKRVRAKATEISWNGEASCLITCRDLSHVQEDANIQCDKGV